MKKIAIAVHGGAGDFGPYLKKNRVESDAGIEDALQTGYQLLKRGKSAVLAVEAAVMKLEDHPLFNAGRGSVLNNKGEIEMDASIMDGKNLMAGAVCMVRSVKNPIHLARHIMTKTKHVLLSGYGALELARDLDIQLESDDYFITDHQYEVYKECRAREAAHKKSKTKAYGTVGAVAMDKKGNLAAATSTGGISDSMPGRIGDSCIIGAGCYANNKTCAVSGTGQGEFLITRVIAHTVAMLIALKGYSLKKACDTAILKQPKPTSDVGIIAISRKGEIQMVFNTETMRRGFIGLDGQMLIETY